MGDIEIYIYDNYHLNYHGYCKYHDIIRNMINTFNDVSNSSVF